VEGAAVGERARDLDPELKVVLMAGPLDPHVHELLAGYRDWPLLPKPVGFSKLADVLKAQLGRPSSRPSPPPSTTRPRRRRTSGHHEA